MTTWQTGPVDRSGASVYAHLVRAKDDPERSPRAAMGTDGSDPKSTWLRRLKKDPARVWADRIAAHLADGVPRTFNRIAVELLDKTADTVFDSPFDHGLWLLVGEGRLAYTDETPVLFRLAGEAP